MTPHRAPAFTIALLLAPLVVRVALPADYVWIEAENTDSANVKPNVAGWGRQQFLSEEKWAQVGIDADKIDAELPA